MSTHATSPENNKSEPSTPQVPTGGSAETARPDSRLPLPAPDQKAQYVATPIEGVFVFYPQVHGDNRGSFHEWFKADAFAQALGYPFIPEQANMSVSAAGVVRGVHLAEVPPGQAKLVTCPAGRVLDIIVDLRRGSDTYLQHVVVELGAPQRTVAYLPVGVGHAFVALEDDSVVAYLTSTGYDPDHEFAVRITDPELGLGLDDLLAEYLPAGTAPIFSERDQAAPLLRDSGDRLPTWDECRQWDNAQRDGWALANEEAGEPV